MKFKKSVLLVFLVILTVILSACGPTAPTIPAEKVTDLGQKIGSVGAYGIYTFNYGDDRCFVSTDDSFGSIDAVAVSCDFGLNQEPYNLEPIYLGSISNYVIYYIVYGDNECYIATDNAVGSIDAVALDCSTK